jgi:uncharacterized protein
MTDNGWPAAPPSSPKLEMIKSRVRSLPGPAAVTSEANPPQTTIPGVSAQNLDADGQDVDTVAHPDRHSAPLQHGYPHVSAKPTALITGASRGIGAAFASRLARAGFTLVLVARDRDELERVAASARDHGADAEILVADLTDKSRLMEVQDRLRDESRPIDMLVNNAGVKRRGAFTAVDEAGLQREIDTNVTAVLQLTHAALPGMIKRRRGAVVNVASFAGYLAGPGDAYAATKAWVLTFTDTTAASLVGTGVRMIALCPGRVRTGMHAIQDDSAGPWLEPRTVVDVCLADLAKGRVLSVPGWRYRAVVDVLELPRRTLRALAELAGRGRTPKVPPRR